MANLVITVIGDDRAGLVDALSGAIVRHGGNWNRSHMAELAGKFAGIVLVTVPDPAVDALSAELEAIETRGLLDVTVERAGDGHAPGAANGVSLELVGQDHPGIVHDISHALAGKGVTIEELETETVSAPMGGHLFKARALLGLPKGLTIGELQDALEDVAHDLMVDLDLDSASS